MFRQLLILLSSASLISAAPDKANNDSLSTNSAKTKKKDPLNDPILNAPSSRSGKSAPGTLKPEKQETASKDNDTTTSSDSGSHFNQTGAEGFLANKDYNIESLTRKIFQNRSDLKEDSLAKAMADAYTTSPVIKEQIAALRASVEKTVQAKGEWRPTINGSLTSNLSKQRDKGDSTTQRSGSYAAASQKSESASVGVELRQNIFAGGQTINKVKEATSNYKAAKSDMTNTEQELLLNVATTYMSLMSKYAEIELLKRNEANLQETLKVTQDKFEVGEETRTSVAQAAAQLADGIAKRISTENQLEQLKASFETLTFRKPGKLSRPSLPKNLPASLEETLERARKNAPALLKAMEAERAARYAVDRVTGALLPSVDLIASSSASKTEAKSRYNQATPNRINPAKDRQVNNSVQVKMTIPLYEAGVTRSQRREASENAEQARIRIEQTRRSIVEKAVASWSKFKTAEAQVGQYRQQVEANLISLDGTQQELLVGSKILLDVLNAIKVLVESQVNLIGAEQNYLAAAYELMAAVGELTAKSLGLKVDLYDPDIHYRETTNSF